MCQEHNEKSTISLINGVRKMNIDMQKDELHPLRTPYIKTNSKWINQKPCETAGRKHLEKLFLTFM
jgi:hypothetical protein